MNDEILNLYKKGLTIQQIADNRKCHYNTIRNVLVKNDVQLRKHFDYKRVVSDDEKQQIINLYLNKKRGIQFISHNLGISWQNVKNILKEFNITEWSRSELIKSNAEHYGVSEQFTFCGRKHKKRSKEKISQSLFKNCNRTVTGSKSKFLNTVVGKVQGSYEVAYLQKLLKDGLTFPKIGDKVKTPIGLYFPDFEFCDRFIEVKSPFTWKVCKGEEKNPKGIKSDVQYKKIQWVNENVKPVEVVILENDEAKTLFKEAIQNKTILTENIIYKNGKYYKETLLPDI